MAAQATSDAHEGPPGFDEVYETHVAFLFRAARGLGVPPSAAEDLVQDVFLVVHRRLHEHDGRSVRAWVLRILVNVVRQHRRRYTRRGGAHAPLDDSPEPVDPAPTPERRAELAEAARMLDVLLSEMPDERREVFVLAEIEGVSASEIAEATEVSVNTVYSRLRLARRDYRAGLVRMRAKSRWRAQ